jgi:hypothetical protein
LINQQQIKDLFDYEDGHLIRKVTTGPRGIKGSKVNSNPTYTEYPKVVISKRSYMYHRVVWLWHHGTLPDMIDHINGNPCDNRIENLRECNNAQNCQNRKVSAANSSGFMGVSWYEPNKRWRAYIKLNGKRKHLGYFKTPEEASEAYKNAKAELHQFNPVQR